MDDVDIRNGAIDLLLSDLADAPLVPEREIDGWMASRGRAAPSPEELRVLECRSRGMTTQMAADALGKSIETVKTQLKAARYILRAKDTTHAVAEALRRGLIA